MLTNPPSDNLYKFITFIGITLMAGSFWLMRETGVRLDDALARYYSANNQWDVGQTAVEEGLADVTSLIERYNQSIAKARTPEELLLSKNMASEVVDRFKSVTTLRSESKRLDAVAKTEYEVINRVLKRTENEQRYAFVGLFFGVLATFSGAVLWYRKHQQFQDSLLIAQIEATKTPPKEWKQFQPNRLKTGTTHGQQR